MRWLPLKKTIRLFYSKNLFFYMGVVFLFFVVFKFLFNFNCISFFQLKGVAILSFLSPAIFLMFVGFKLRKDLLTVLGDREAALKKKKALIKTLIFKSLRLVLFFGVIRCFFWLFYSNITQFVSLLSALGDMSLSKFVTLVEIFIEDSILFIYTAPCCLIISIFLYFFLIAVMFWNKIFIKQGVQNKINQSSSFKIVLTIVPEWLIDFCKESIANLRLAKQNFIHRRLMKNIHERSERLGIKDKPIKEMDERVEDWTLRDNAAVAREELQIAQDKLDAAKAKAERALQRTEEYLQQHPLYEMYKPSPESASYGQPIFSDFTLLSYLKESLLAALSNIPSSPATAVSAVLSGAALAVSASTMSDTSAGSSSSGAVGISESSSSLTTTGSPLYERMRKLSEESGGPKVEYESSLDYDIKSTVAEFPEDVVVPQVDAPIVVPQVDAPIVVPQVDAPIVVPQVDAPIVVPQVDAPAGLPPSGGGGWMNLFTSTPFIIGFGVAVVLGALALFFYFKKSNEVIKEIAGDGDTTAALKDNLESALSRYYETRNDKINCLDAARDIYGSPHVAAQEASEKAGEFMGSEPVRECWEQIFVIGDLLEKRVKGAFKECMEAAKESADIHLNELTRGSVEALSNNSFNFSYKLDLNAPFELIEFPPYDNVILFGNAVSISEFFVVSSLLVCSYFFLVMARPFFGNQVAGCFYNRKNGCASWPRFIAYKFLFSIKSEEFFTFRFKDANLLTSPRANTNTDFFINTFLKAKKWVIKTLFIKVDNKYNMRLSSIHSNTIDILRYVRSYGNIFCNLKVTGVGKSTKDMFVKNKTARTWLMVLEKKFSAFFGAGYIMQVSQEFEHPVVFYKKCIEKVMNTLDFDVKNILIYLFLVVLLVLLVLRLVRRPKRFDTAWGNKGVFSVIFITNIDLVIDKKYEIARQWWLHTCRGEEACGKKFDQVYSTYLDLIKDAQRGRVCDSMESTAKTLSHLTEGCQKDKACVKNSYDELTEAQNNLAECITGPRDYFSYCAEAAPHNNNLLTNLSDWLPATVGVVLVIGFMGLLAYNFFYLKASSSVVVEAGIDKEQMIAAVKKILETSLESYYSLRNNHLNSLNSGKDLYGSPYKTADDLSRSAADFMNSDTMTALWEGISSIKTPLEELSSGAFKDCLAAGKKVADAQLNELSAGAIEICDKNNFNFLFELDLNAPFEFINFPAGNFILLDISISATTFFVFMPFLCFLAFLSILIFHYKGYFERISRNCISTIIIYIISLVLFYSLFLLVLRLSSKAVLYPLFNLKSVSTLQKNIFFSTKPDSGEEIAEEDCEEVQKKEVSASIENEIIVYDGRNALGGLGENCVEFFFDNVATVDNTQNLQHAPIVNDKNPGRLGDFWFNSAHERAFNDMLWEERVSLFQELSDICDEESLHNAISDFGRRIACASKETERASLKRTFDSLVFDLLVKKKYNSVKHTIQNLELSFREEPCVFARSILKEVVIAALSEDKDERTRAYNYFGKKNLIRNSSEEKKIFDFLKKVRERAITLAVEKFCSILKTEESRVFRSLYKEFKMHVDDLSRGISGVNKKDLDAAIIKVWNDIFDGNEKKFHKGVEALKEGAFKIFVEDVDWALESWFAGIIEGAQF